MGDPAGTGPELIVKALIEPEVRAACRPLVIGDAAVLRDAARIVGLASEVRVVRSPSEVTGSAGVVEVLDLANMPLAELRRAEASPQAGEAAYQYILRAVELARRGEIDGVVTSAINKAALHAAGHAFDGHTELLAELCGQPKVTMMLVAGRLRISHVSTHVALREAIARVRPERIGEVIDLTVGGLRQLGIHDPRIAVAGLNPHASEGGIFGDEEARAITPAIEAACNRGHRVTGPYPGDTIFFRASQGEFDAVVAMYHDQGHIAAKMLGIWQGVNVTIGLPIIRTSVEHGTDFQNAGRGTGDPRSLIEAIKLAAVMARRRGKNE
ncbi:MAG: pdxA [Verrucomicrobia bacterium]|nr:pdxA [Verrucomicrobiota bacterium]